MPAARAGRASPEPASGLGHSATIAIAELADRCEQATGPDRELDVLLAYEAGLIRGGDGHGYYYGAGNECDYVLERGCDAREQDAPELPYFTASLDAAMTLVPEGWGPALDSVERGKLPMAELWHHEAKHDGGGMPYQERAKGVATTLALALCAAALRARAAQ